MAIILQEELRWMQSEELEECLFYHTLIEELVMV